MAGIEQGIGDVFTAIETWLVSTGATASVMRLAWALLTVLWLGHVAVSTRPGREPDLIGAFARLVLAGGLLSGIGRLNQVILLGFETFRAAGAAVLHGLLDETWPQFVQTTLLPRFAQLLHVWTAVFAYPWVIWIVLAGCVSGAVLFAVGAAVYLAILFFAHLTLLLALFLAPLAVALLAAPSTQLWTARWAMIVVRTGLVVFCVRVVHAAMLYLAIMVPFRDMAAILPTPASPQSGLGAIAALLLRLAGVWMLMLVGTGVGVYAMLRVERLVAQFAGGEALGGAMVSGPLWLLRGQVAASYAGQASRVANVNSVPGGGASPYAAYEAAEGGRASGGGAQEAAVLRGSRR